MKKCILFLFTAILTLASFGQEAGTVEAAAGGVVIEQFQGAPDAIGDEAPGAGGAVEELRGGDDQPVLAAVEAVEPG